MDTPSSPSPVDLLSLVPDELAAELERHFAARGHKPYRARQVVRWLYERNGLFGPGSNLTVS